GEPVAGLARKGGEDGERVVDVADDQVGAAVVVQVAEAHSAGQVIGLVITADLPADVLEPAAQVAVQHGRVLAADARLRVVADDMAVDDEQVLPAVQVHVEERRAPAAGLLAQGGQAGRYRLVPDTPP